MIAGALFLGGLGGLPPGTTMMSCARQHDRAALILIHQSAGDVGAGSSFPSFLVLITFTG